MSAYNFSSARVAIVTGGGSGIGRALCLSLAKRGVRTIVSVDVDLDGASSTCQALQTLGGSTRARAVRCDVSQEAHLDRLISEVERNDGPVDAFFANAGIGGDFGTIDGASMTLWHNMMAVNLYQSVFAARRLLPGLAQRGGCFAVTSSAAGLLMQLGTVAYTTTKHASRAFAEWLAVTYGDAGLRVACLCPQAVESKMTANGSGVAGQDGMISAEVAADSLLEALESGRFLALPHPEVATYVRRKADDVDRWIQGMRRLQARMLPTVMPAKAKL